MSLRARTLTIIAAVFAVLGVSVYLLFSSILMTQFIHLENDALRADLGRVNAALDNSLDQLVSSTTDWAQWDATYDFMKDKNEEYLTTNYTYETLSAVAVERLVFFNADKVPFRELKVSLARETLFDQKLGFAPEVFKLATLLPSPEATSNSKGLLRSGDAILMFASIPIVDSKRSSPVLGYLVRTFNVDQLFFETLAKQTRLEMQAITIGEASLNKVPPESYSIKEISDSILSGTGYLSDRFGNSLVEFTVKKPRVIFGEGMRTRNLLLIMLLAVGVIALTIAFAVINRWILRRFISLGSQLSQINVKKDFSARVDDNGHDEIGELGSLTNQVLESLEVAQKEALAQRQIAELANESKTVFFSSASHDIKNPLSSIKGLLEAGLRKEMPKELEDLLRAAYGSVNQLSSFVNHLLDFHKAESGKLTFEKISFDIRKLITNVRGQLIGSVASKKNVRLVIDVHPDVPTAAMGDPVKMQQVFENLVGNALKFTKEGYVGISVRYNSGDEESRSKGLLPLLIEIWDTGIGIPPDKLVAIFEPYKQAENSTTRMYQGTGLGLSITKKIVEGMFGNIEVFSKLGEGSRFVVSIALEAALEADGAIQATAPGASPYKDFGDVAIVSEESKSSAALLSNMSLLGVNTRLFDSSLGYGALQSAIKNSQAIVITERALLEQSVIELAASISQNPQVCVVCLVNPINIDLRSTLYAKGINHILTEPALAEEVLQTIETREVAQNNLALTNNTDSHCEEFNLPKAKGSFNVLFADDTLTNRISSEDLLTHAGYNVEIVCDGHEVVAAFEGMIKGVANAKTFDIILTDVTMGEMNGTIAAQKIRQLELQYGNSSHIPIIAITAHTALDEIARIREYGIDEVVTKPICVKELAGVLERYLTPGRSGPER